MTEIPSRSLGRCSLPLPALGLGTAPLGDLFETVDEADARDTLQAAWDGGIRYFDTAPWYGHGLSEHRLGSWLRRQSRGSFLCSSKVGRVYRRVVDPVPGVSTAPWIGGLPFTPRFDYSYDGIMRSYEDSLLRLGLARIDILVIHDLDFGYHRTQSEVTARLRELDSGWRALEELESAGEIAAIGAGINDESMMSRFLGRWPVDFFLVALPYTLMDQAVLEDQFPACEEHGIGIVVGAPYASGILATGAVAGARYRYAPADQAALSRVSAIQAICDRHGVPLKAAALQFPLAHPIVASVIPGAVSAAQVRENRALLDVAIPAAMWAELRDSDLLHPQAPEP